MYINPRAIYAASNSSKRMFLGSPFAISSLDPTSKNDTSFEFSDEEGSDDGSTAQRQAPKYHHKVSKGTESSSPSPTKNNATKFADKKFNTVDLSDIPSTPSSPRTLNNASDSDIIPVSRFRQPTASPVTENLPSTFSERSTSTLKSKTLSNPHSPSPQTGDRFYEHIARKVKNDTSPDATPPRKSRKKAMNLDQFRGFAPSKTASPQQPLGDAWETSVEEQVFFNTKDPELESSTDHELLSNDQDENEDGFDETTGKIDDTKSEASSPGIAIKDEEDEEEVALISVQEASR